MCTGATINTLCAIVTTQSEKNLVCVDFFVVCVDLLFDGTVCLDTISFSSTMGTGATNITLSSILTTQSEKNLVCVDFFVVCVDLLFDGTVHLATIIF